jgi:integrase
MGGFLLGNYSKPPVREPKTHEANLRAAKHLKFAFATHRLTDLTPDDIELFLRERLRQRVKTQTSNVVRIIAETGLRVKKELLPMRKQQVDLANSAVWIADSKTPGGVAEVPLTPIALDAFRSQISLAEPGEYLFPAPRIHTNAKSR